MCASYAQSASLPHPSGISGWPPAAAVSLFSAKRSSAIAHSDVSLDQGEGTLASLASALLMLAYNMKRVIAILGYVTLLEAMQT